MEIVGLVESMWSQIVGQIEFLSSFGLSTPSDPLPAPAIEVESDESDHDDHDRHNFKGRSSDEGLRLGAVSTPLHHIDWECTSSCRYGRQCASNAGFLPFVVKLRNMFWGPKGSKAPSSSARKGKIKDIANTKSSTAQKSDTPNTSPR